MPSPLEVARYYENQKNQRLGAAHPNQNRHEGNTHPAKGEAQPALRALHLQTPDGPTTESAQKETKSPEKITRQGKPGKIFEVFSSGTADNHLEMLAKLTPKQRLIVTLRLGLGDNEPLTPKEIEERTGISANTVSTHLYLAADRLTSPDKLARQTKTKAETKVPTQNSTKIITETNEQIVEGSETDVPTEGELLKLDEEIESGKFDMGEVKDVNGMRNFLNRLRRFPLLSAEQEVILSKLFQQETEEKEKIKQGQQEEDKRTSTLAQLKASFRDPNSEFSRSIDEGKREKFRTVLIESDSVKDLFANCNLRLVVNIAKRYRTNRLTLEDRIQAGAIGLNRTIEKFDYTKGFKFSTYATHWIKQAIDREAQDTDRFIRVPVYLGQAVDKANRIASKFFTDKGREPKPEELLELLEPDDNNRRLLEKAVDYYFSPESKMDSLNRIVGGPKGDGNAELGELVADRRENNHDEAVSSVLAAQIRDVFGTLSEREQGILRMRHLEEKTLDVIGKEYGVTRERIRQIEVKLQARLGQNSQWRTLAEQFGYELPELKQEKKRGPGRNSTTQLNEVLPGDPKERKELINKLPKFLSDIVLLRTEEVTPSYQEVAEILDITGTVAAARERQALDMLQSLISTGEFTEAQKRIIANHQRKQVQVFESTASSGREDFVLHAKKNRLDFREVFAPVATGDLHMLDQLTETQKRIVTLRLGLDGETLRSTQQVAEELHTSDAEVRSMLYQAVKQVTQGEKNTKSRKEISLQEAFAPAIAGDLSLLDKLTPRERNVVTRALGLDGKEERKITQIAKEFGVNTSAICNTIERAIGRVIDPDHFPKRGEKRHNEVIEIFMPIIVSGDLEVLDRLLTKREREVISLYVGLDGSEPLTTGKIMETSGIRDKSTLNIQIRSAVAKVMQANRSRHEEKSEIVREKDVSPPESNQDQRQPMSKFEVKPTRNETAEKPVEKKRTPRKNNAAIIASAIEQEGQAILNQLSKREQEIVTLRLGLTGEKPKTPEEIAASLEISRNNVDVTLSNAMRKLTGPKESARKNPEAFTGKSKKKERKPSAKSTKENRRSRASQSELTSLIENDSSLLERLSERQRKVVELRLGLTGEGPKGVQEVAAILDISPKNVSVALSRAKENMQKPEPPAQKQRQAKIHETFAPAIDGDFTILDKLTPRERQVVTMTLGLGGTEKTRVQIAKELGISSQGVSTTLSRAIEVVKNSEKIAHREQSHTEKAKERPKQTGKATEIFSVQAHKEQKEAALEITFADPDNSIAQLFKNEHARKAAQELLGDEYLVVTLTGGIDLDKVYSIEETAKIVQRTPEEVEKLQARAIRYMRKGSTLLFQR